MQNKISLSLFSLFALSLFIVLKTFSSSITASYYVSVCGCIILAMAVFGFNNKKQILDFTVSEVLITCFLIFTIVCHAYLGLGVVNAVWILSFISLLFFYMLVRRILLIQQWIFVGIVLLGFIQAAYGIVQYLGLTNNYINTFRINGSFDNPAGFAASLVAVFPFALCLVAQKKFFPLLLGAFSVGIIVVSVVLSHSRAGVVGLILIVFIWLLYVLHINFSKKLKVVAGSIIIIALIVGLYFVKKDSANGRLLIWQCSAHMIADKPLFGHGIGGFQREYMLYQAEYFRNHPNSSFVMLADIVKHPFNEYLLLVVEHGLIGVLSLGLFIFYLIKEYRRNKTLETFYAMLCLVGSGVFACFSYPLGYPFIRLIVVFCTALIMQHETKRWKIPKGLFSIIKPAVLVVLVALLVLTCNMFYDEYRWNIIAQRSLAGETKKVLPEYAKLYKTMNRNGLFLYNYAAELNFIDQNTESNRLFIEASHFMNDIDLQLQMADNYQKMKQYKETEKCLLEAHYMIPNRFIPLYRLAKLYEETNQLERAKYIAKTILKKPIKIMSPEILTIQIEMKELINKI